MSETYRVSIDIDVNDRSPASIQRATDRVNALDQAIRRMQKQANDLGMNFAPRFNFRNFDEAEARIEKIRAQTERLRAATAQASGPTGGGGTNPFEWMARGAQMALAPVNALFNALTSVRSLILGYEVQRAFDAFVVGPMRLADYYTRANIGLQTMFRTMNIGNDRDADSFMRQAVGFGISSPLRNRESIRDAMQLLTFRFTPDQVLGPADAGGGRTGRGGMLEAIMNASIAGSPEDPQGAMHRITVALGQIRAAGRVNAQDMLQLTNANIRAWEYLGDGLQRDFGIQASMQEIRQMAENNMIPPLRAVNWIVEGMRRDFDGLGASTANQTTGGLLSQIADYAEYNVFYRFGEGLKMGAIPGLQRLNEWLGANQVTAERWGFTLFEVGRDASEFAVTSLETLARALERVSNSAEFQNASGFGRIGVAFRQLVSDPFSAWWNERSSPDPEHAGLGETGGEMTGRKIGEALGTAAGTGLRFGLETLFGMRGGGGAGGGFVESLSESFSRSFGDALDPDLMMAKFKAWMSDPANWFPNVTWDQSRVGGPLRSSGQSIPMGDEGNPYGVTGAAISGIVAGGQNPITGSRDPRDTGTVYGPPAPPTGFQTARDKARSGRGPIEAFGDFIRSINPFGATSAEAAELMSPEFGNADLTAQFVDAGFTPETVKDACAPIVAAGMARSFGIAANEAEIAKNARLPGGGRAFEPGVGATSSKESLKAMLRYAGLVPMDLDEAQAQQMAGSGRMVGINTADHYFGANAYDPATGRYHVGSTGANGFQGGSDWMTIDQMTRGGSNPLRGFVGATVPRGGDLLQTAGGLAQRYGVDPRALQAILMTENAMQGQVGDNGQSWGPLQFHRQGQLPAYARDLGMSLDEAGEYARAHPEHAIEWATRGYLGDALRRGQSMGLTGADLATYGQREGQRSESPERAGANYGRTPGVHIDQINLTAYNASDDEAKRLANGIVEHVADALADRMEPDNATPGWTR